MRTIFKALGVLGLAAGLALTSVQTAEAGRRGHGGAGFVAGAAAAAITLGVLGAYASRPAYGGYYSYSRGPRCYRGREHCGWVGRRCWENRWGDTRCRGGEWRCWRKSYCD